MAKIATEDLLEAFKEMTLIELSEFVKQFEDTFGVTAAAPVATPVGTKSAAVRLLTRPVAGKKMVAAKGQSQRVADAAKPSQKPQAGGGRRGPRRGASKGR